MEKESLSTPDEFDVLANSLNLDVETRTSARKLFEDYKHSPNFKVICFSNFRITGITSGSSWDVVFSSIQGPRRC
jgi:hypothetical protein